MLNETKVKLEIREGEVQTNLTCILANPEVNIKKITAPFALCCLQIHVKSTPKLYAKI